MARTTREERRVDYLDVGVDMLTEGTSGRPGPGLAFAHIRIADVADRAGVTKGALYHLWDSQEHYWHDLMLFLLEEGRLAGMPDITDATQEHARHVEGVPNPVEWANFVFDRFRDDPSFFARIGKGSYLQETHEVRGDLDEEFRSSLDEFESMVTAAVEQMGRTPRPGIDIRDFAVSVASLMHGFCLEHRIDPARTPDFELDGERTSLFAVAVTALLDAFTESSPQAPGSAGAAGAGGSAEAGERR